ncbi:hypothetical protein HLK59_26165 [Streptomyces sp. S3(2020)]|uniref:nSTAND1 domain-containing NTPase n=1 Tax=Streptomyces sp. S3(2020) TaxID=2732044 RepID=UPI001489188C|nr:hypothetical protein [Streptomyces sp. S3(2020)]NNN33787.1 hypothetical protein [Streptomyces sp. S3(2020)]
MGRPEVPVDPAAGPMQRLAHEMRELRRAAGSPSYRTMADAAGFTAATLSKAADGTRLPSLAVVQGYARACGDTPDRWERLWKETEAAVAVEPRDDADAVPPYRGLARYEPGDQGLFFGRDRLVSELAELVCGNRFAVVFGASGSGKSSLLRAGLVPRLREEIAGRRCPAVLRVFTPGPRPAETYGHLLAPGAGEPESWVVVDQFEEVFTLCRDRAERNRFIDLLLAARDPGSRVRVLIAVRADFYARCGEHHELGRTLCGAALLVGPMTAGELREVVVKPAQATGLTVERELTARLVEEVLDEPGALPMLSHALLETWLRRRGRMLTVASYEAAGGLRGAIAATAEAAYEQLSDGQALAARRLLLRMVEPGQGTPDTRRPLTRGDLTEWTDPDVRAAVDGLTRARLLTVDDDGVHLAHEALITCWPRLHDWIEADRERLRHHRQLTEAARVWLEHDCDPGALYRGARLARAAELFPGHADDPSLTSAERDFLGAAFTARDAERRAVTRGRRKARTLVSTLSAVLAVALVAGFVAWRQHDDNERRATDDAARRVSEVADALRTTDPRTAMLLGLAAWDISPLPESRRALLASLAQPETDTFTDPAPGGTPARFLIDSGRTLLSVDGRTWRTWNVATHRRTDSGRLPSGQVTSVSPDGRMLAVYLPTVGDGAIRLWNTATGRWAGASKPTAVAAVDFVAGGRDYLESGMGDDHGVRLRSVADGRLLFETQAPTPANVTPSTDGRRVAVCPAGSAPQLWDIAGHRMLHGAWEKAGAICGDRSLLVFGASGRFAALTDDQVRVWDTASGSRVADLDVPGAAWAAFSPDGTFLAAVQDGEVKVWRLAAPATPVFRHPLNNQHVDKTLTWDPTRPRLRYLEGDTVHTLDLTTPVTARWSTRPLERVLLSPDGRTLATAERTGGTYRVQLRDTRDGHLIRSLPSPPPPVSRVTAEPVDPSGTQPLMAFGPEGDTLAYGVFAASRTPAEQRVTVWDLERGRVRTTLGLPTAEPGQAVVSLTLGAGGRTLYVARNTAIDKRVYEVWDTVGHRRTSVFPANGANVAVRPDGRLLAGDDRVVRLPSGTPTRRDLAPGAETGALTFAPDGSRLAVGDRTGRISLWDTDVRHRDGVLRNVFPAPSDDTDTTEAVTALAFSPDGHTLAVAGDHGTLQLWDVPTQQPLGGPLATPGDPIVSLAFSGDSKTLYSSGTRVPLQHYTVDPAQAVARICDRTQNSGLSKAQWRAYIPDAPPEVLCGHDVASKP